MSGFEITAWDDGAVHVVKVVGEFDLTACRAFREKIAAPGSELVVADLREATFLDSHALGVLIQLHGEARERGFSLAILRPEGHADRIFKMTGADGYLPLYDERVPILAHFNYG
jgi:anti-anti-sigma factor